MTDWKLDPGPLPPLVRSPAPSRRRPGPRSLRRCRRRRRCSRRTFRLLRHRSLSPVLRRLSAEEEQGSAGRRLRRRLWCSGWSSVRWRSTRSAAGTTATAASPAISRDTVLPTSTTRPNFPEGETQDATTPTGRWSPGADQSGRWRAPPSLDRSKEPIAAAAAAVKPAVVQLETAFGLGSGFIYDPNGYILTAAHVVENAKKVTVRLGDGSSKERHRSRRGRQHRRGGGQDRAVP